MKKILFINSCLTSGGSERVMTLLANEFADRGYKVSMILLREKEDTYTVDKRVKVIRFHYKFKSKICIAVKRLFLLRQEFKRDTYDIAIAFMYDINLISIICNLGINTPLLISERADPNSLRHGKLYRKIENRLYMKSKQLILQTEQIKSYFSKEMQRQATVIPNPININIQPVYGGRRDKRIVAIGRLTEQKNFSLLIDSFFEIHKRYPEYILEIYGEGPLLKVLQAQVEKLGLTDHVIFPGYVTDILKRIERAALYVSSSNYEGISNSMLEAMALGIPSVCTDCPVGGAAMVIKNNENGILVPVKDKASLTNAIAKIIEDPAFAEKIAHNAVFVRETFSIKKIADLWEKQFS